VAALQFLEEMAEGSAARAWRGLRFAGQRRG
jgi:hypothetical protein